MTSVAVCNFDLMGYVCCYTAWVAFLNKKKKISISNIQGVSKKLLDD